ncbi:MAG: pyridoxal phosphate-dependent aminotransferase [Muribaculaceae bacterium]|nr:pyridoxal phosphate-dependent aminotransferase [Muribaculaceae bacterium]
MIQISNRIKAMAQSATMAMTQKSAELRAQGVDVITMSVGEPDFNTPDFVKEAAKKAIDENYSKYSPAPGYLSTREAICRKLEKENGLKYTPAQIVVGNGAKQELCNAVLALVNPGDEVIIPMPAWVSYVEMVRLAEGKVVEVWAGVDQDFKLTPEQLEAAITPKSRMIILNNPSNPTGSVYSEEELKGLAAVLAKYPDIVILADDIYEHINFLPGRVHSIAECPEVFDRTVVINGVSKAYAMTGWRIGYLAAPAEVAKAVSKLQGQYTSGPSSIAQKAAEAALDGPQEFRYEMREAFERRRDLIVELAKEIPGWIVNRPEGAFYLFPEVSAYVGKVTPAGKKIGSSGDYTMYLLEEAHVACVDGAAFGAPGYMRLSYATSDDKIREAMRRIKEASLLLMHNA